MKIYFKAPYYKDSNFMGHLVEHCILHPDKTIITQCILKPWTSGALSGEHMYITFDNYVDQKDIFEMLNKPITQKMIDYEYKIFEEEFGNMSYIIRLLEKLSKVHYGDHRSQKPTLYSLEEVQVYHKKYIQDGEYVIVDGDVPKILSHNVPVDSLSPISEIIFPNIEYSLMLLQGEKNFIMVWDNSSYIDVIYGYFLYHIIKAWDSYKKRYELESYYTQPPTPFFNTQYCILRISPHTVLDISVAFFQAQKKYFMQSLINHNYAFIEVGTLLYHHQIYELDKAIQFIEGISYDDYMAVIKKVQSL